MADLKNTLFRFYLRRFYPPGFTRQRSLNEQQRVFESLLSSLAGTALGKDLQLDKIRAVQGFATAVPVTQYSFYEPYVERIRAGEQRVMTKHGVAWFGKTAGTTSGKSKLVPVTQDFIHRCHVRGTFLGLSRLYGMNESANILKHKNFVMTGGVYERDKPSGIPIADISAIMMRNVPIPFRTIYVPSVALSTHPSWEYKVEKIAQLISHADVGSISGIPTWHLAVLNKIRERKPFDKLTDLWKNVRIFFHGGVNFEPYRQHFKELSGRDDFIFYEFYNATEGFFGIQAEPEGGDLLLLTDTGVFYEFIPFSEFEGYRFPLSGDIRAGVSERALRGGDAKAIQLNEVKPGIPYVLLISTLNGLLRYVIGDVITFSAIDPFKFRIVGRTQEYINAFGEDLLLTHVERAMSATNKKFNSIVREFTVAPLYIHLGAKGRMQFVMEFDYPPADLNAYALELDEQLKRENSNYLQKRNNDIALSPLEVIPVNTGTFYRWLESKGKLGGQNKVPRLMNNRKLMEEILGMI